MTKSRKYKRIYLTAGSTFVGLLVILMSLGLNIIDLTGDTYCKGTLEDPCFSEFKVNNPTSKNIYVYHKGKFGLNFSPNIKDYAFYVKDGRCSGKLTGSSCSCFLKNGSELAYKGWRCVDFTNRTKPSKKNKYVFKWPAYSSKRHLLVGFKNNPSDEIKWTATIKGEDTLDPIWFGVKDNNYSVQSGDWINETRNRLKYINKKENVTETINGTEYSYEIVTKIPIIESYFYSNLSNNGNIYIDGLNYSIKGFFCSFDSDKLWIECDSKFDGNGDGVCQRQGGETCIVFNLGATEQEISSLTTQLNLTKHDPDKIGVVKYD